MLLTQAPVPAPKPPTPTAAHHQFDFWLGEWEVKDPSGQVVGHNRIESIANGYGLLENWTDLRGGSGKSLNAYESSSGTWHQTWVGSGGGVIRFDGGIKAGKMWLEGSRLAKGGLVRDRMTYEPRKDGTVRQLWEGSSDDGKTWQIAFDGLYVKAGGADANRARN
jgi:hypothetical protein